MIPHTPNSDSKHQIHFGKSEFWYESIDPWGTVSSAYKNAADLLCEGYRDDPEKYGDLVFPALFLYRHYVELGLKELIACCREANTVKSDMPGIHTLPKIFDSLSSLISSSVKEGEIHMPDGSIQKVSDALDLLHETANEWNKIDETSHRFRYPENRKGKPNPYPLLRNELKVMDPSDLKAKMDRYHDAINLIALGILAEGESMMTE